MAENAMCDVTAVIENSLKKKDSAIDIYENISDLHRKTACWVKRLTPFISII